jgi:CheY-like chemotaxis protein
MNLGSNAGHAMCETGGVLAVCLDVVAVDADFAARHQPLRPGPHVRLTVSDTGHGMTPEVVERIFEPFFTTKGVGDGTGLGLAVVHGIITDHGGAVTVQSAPGQGTSFEIYLPYCRHVASTVPAAASLVPGSERILFVDDEEVITRMVQAMLEPLGYTLVAYTNSLSALEAFRSTPQAFDLVITDHAMPHMTGQTFARAIRAIRPDIPIILCTGLSRTMTAEKAAALGLNGYLLKPLVTPELSRAIREVLDQRVMGEGPSL